MPDLVYERDAVRFAVAGVDLNRPVDAVKAAKFPILENVRSRQDGRLDPRDGLTSLGSIIASKTPVHSARRLNDPNGQAYTLVIGTGDRLAYGTPSSYTNADGAYSGDPLALVPYRPDQSPNAWMYVADRSRMRKINVSGTVHQIGMPAPTVAPSAALGVPVYKVVQECQTAADWTQAGDAGGGGGGNPTLLGYRMTGTITYITYDSGTTGWASVSPSTMAGLGVGCRLNFNPGGGADELTVIQEIHPASTATTIASIIYDSGTTGACSIVLTAPVEEIKTNSYIRIAAAENCRVTSVSRGKDGTLSLRTSTASNRVATNAVVALASIRVYLANNHAAAETVRIDALRSTFTYSTGSGTLTDSPAALDLSTFSASRSVRPDDYIHISVRVDRPDLISEGKVLLDVDSATVDFTRNFYYRAFRSSDLTPSVRNAQTLLTTKQRIIQRTLIDKPIYTGGGDYPRDSYTTYEPPPEPEYIEEEVVVESDQTAPGDVQWTELRFRVGDLIRVGTDTSRTLANVAALRISLVITGTVVFDYGSWWIGGGYSPDTSSIGSPYVYRYRARCSTTGVRSNPSPAIRGGLTPQRQSITVTPTQYTAATEADVLDIERFGGVIDTWHYVGTCTNSATPTFTDEQDDDIVAQNPDLGRASFQPWPVIDVPRSGTTGTVAGTSLTDSGTTFNTSWAQGTTIEINGLPYTIYRVISTSRMEIFENAGSQGAVAWRIPEPVLVGQPLPCLWGPFDETAFACGDPINPGRLYFTNAKDFDTVAESLGAIRGGYIDVTDPSEPLMNGLVYNARAFVFSTRRLFEIIPTPGAPNRFMTREVAGCRGLFSRWALTRLPAPRIWYVGEDGSIYETTGDASTSITDEDLYPLFPNEGQAGVATNGFSPPNIAASEATYLRLDFAKDYLYFNYRDTNSARRTLAYRVTDRSWFPDVYTPGIVFHYGEEGGSGRTATVLSVLCGGADATTALLYQFTGNTDAGTAFTCHVRTPSRDQGDSRANKLYGDLMLDANTSSVSLTCTPGFNNHATTSTAVTVSSAARTQSQVSVGSAWVVARNVSLDITWSQASASRPALYIWESRWHEEPGPVSATSWETPALTHASAGFLCPYDMYIAHVASADLSLVITVDGVAQSALTITHNSSAYKRTYVRLPVMKGKSLKYRLTSTAEFRVYGSESEIRIRDWSDPGPLRRVPLFSDIATGASA